MWVASILQVLALGAVDPAAPLAASTAPAPIYWRQTLFSIPFHVERPVRAGQEPTEVQLHVSPDRGVHWDNWRQAPPQKGYFLFKAGTDGEYWFDVRTLDRSGQIRPQGPHTPKLIVIVDTVPPKVQLTAIRGDAGQITAAFRIEELYPKLDSMAIEYRLDSTTAWQTVPVGPKDVRSNNAEHRGEVTWYPQNASGTMEIRLRVNDMAGNPAESHTHLVLPAVPGGTATANPVRPPLESVAAIPVGTNPLGPRAPTSPAATTASASPAPATTTAASPAVAAQATEAWQPLGPPTGKTSWPAENANPAFIDPVRPPGSQNDPGNGSVVLRVNSPVTHQFVADQQPASPAAASAPVNPFNGFTASRPTGPATATSNVGPPPGAQLRWINTRVFQLDYDTRVMVGVANMPVELWGTRDGGKSWQSFGKDLKGQSPMLVTVPEEGIYGFRMAIQDGPGTAGRPPLPGDVPGYWVGIDLTRPVGRITQAKQGIGPDGDKLFIAWEASDNRELAAKPVSLSYSERLGGPWTSMATGLENTGRYAWQLTGSLPQRMYLRLEIHDAAGNMGLYETPEPVTLDLSSPSAQLRDLRPLGRLDSQPAEQTYLR
ncbi:MAG: hypothetical protein ACLP9L_02015 [Thermoguttaceae bacterium]